MGRIDQLIFCCADPRATLAEALSPVVGTVLETHPRACALFGLGAACAEYINTYKYKTAHADPEDPPRELEIKASYVYEWPGLRFVNRKLTLHLTPDDLTKIVQAALAHGLVELEQTALRAVHKRLGRIIDELECKQVER